MLSLKLSGFVCPQQVRNQALKAAAEQLAGNQEPPKHVVKALKREWERFLQSKT